MMNEQNDQRKNNKRKRLEPVGSQRLFFREIANRIHVYRAEDKNIMDNLEQKNSIMQRTLKSMQLEECYKCKEWVYNTGLLNKKCCNCPSIENSSSDSDESLICFNCSWDYNTCYSCSKQWCGDCSKNNDTLICTACPHETSMCRDCFDDLRGIKRTETFFKCCSCEDYFCKDCLDSRTFECENCNEIICEYCIRYVKVCKDCENEENEENEEKDYKIKFLALPKDIIHKILLYSEPEEIRTMCNLNRNLYEKVYLNEIFWMNKIITEFDIKVDLQEEENNYKSSKDFYKEIINLPAEKLLLKGVDYNSLKTVNIALKKGADINTYRDSALISSCENGQLELVKCLVEHGADISVENSFSIELACLNGHLEVVKYLVNQGVDVRADCGFNLGLASSNGHLEVVKYLESLM